MLRINLSFVFSATFCLAAVADEASTLDALLQQAPFTADAEALLEAVEQREAPEEHPFEILLYEDQCELSEEGRTSRQIRMVYRIFTREVIDDGGGAMRANWSPWYEERPEMDARVISPTGRVYRLDPATIDDSPAANDTPNVYSDQRLLEAPLPGVAVDAVVEIVTRRKDRRPFFSGGLLQEYALDTASPGGRVRIELKAPPTVGLMHVVSGTEHAATVKKDSQGTTLRWEHPAPRSPTLQRFPPRDATQTPLLWVSTGPSWNVVAQHYHALIASQVGGKEVAQEAKRIVGETQEVRAQAGELLAYLQRQIRYTGIAFGDASIVPNKPSEALRRGYGDCKDQSVYLVSLLRAVGIEAHPALVRVGTYEAVRPELPGLNWFDHMIVYLPTEELWIDPTTTYTAVGQIPAPLEGRLALIVHPETRALQKIPFSTSSENTFREDFEVQLPALDYPKVTHRIEVRGTSAWNYRDALASLPARSREKRLEEYFQEQLEAEEVTRVQLNDPEDLSTPFVTEGTGVSCKLLAESYGAETYAYLRPLRVFEDVPWLAVASDEELEELALLDSVEEVDDSPPQPLHLPVRSVRESRYRIVPPPGFELVDTPEDETHQFGPAEYTSRYRLVDEGVLEVAFRFDTGDGRLDPEAAASLRQTYQEMNELADEAGVITLHFAQVAAQHLAAGRVEQSLSAYATLCEQHPEEPLYQAQYAEALLDAGFGVAAQDLAQEAVTAAPDIAVAQAVQGKVWASDDLGAFCRGAVDFQRSEQNLRKSLQLSPDSPAALGTLIDLLEHDDNGNRYSPHARLTEADRIYKKLRRNGQFTDSMESWRAKNLFFSERFAQLRRQLRNTPLSTDVLAIDVASRALEDGPESAVRHLRSARVSDEQRRTVLAVASDYAGAMRRYEVALALMDAALLGLPPNSQPGWEAIRDRLRHIRPYEEVRLPDEDPREVVQRLVLLAFRGKRDLARDRAIFAPRRIDADAPGESLTQLQLVAEASRRPTLDASGAAYWVGDLVSFVEFSSPVEVGPFYVVTCRGAGPRKLLWCVVAEGDEYRVVDGGRNQVELAKRALDAIADSDFQRAQHWLEAAYQLQKANVGWFDPFAGSPFGRLWFKNARRHGDESFLKLATAALMAPTLPTAPGVVDLLREALEDESQENQLQLRRALTAAYYPGDLDACLAETEAILATPVDAAEPYLLRAKAFMKQQQWSLVRQVVSRKSFPSKAQAAGERLRVLTYVAEDRLEHAQTALDKLANSALADPETLDLLARLSLLRNQNLDEALEHCQSALEQSSFADAKVLGAQAAVHAALGQTTDALNLLAHRRLLDAREARDAADWYVTGRRAEAMNLPNIAVRSYRRVELAEDDLQPLSWNHLAKRRVQLLEKATTP